MKNSASMIILEKINLKVPLHLFSFIFKMKVVNFETIAGSNLHNFFENNY